MKIKFSLEKIKRQKIKLLWLYSFLIVIGGSVFFSQNYKQMSFYKQIRRSMSSECGTSVNPCNDIQKTATPLPPLDPNFSVVENNALLQLPQMYQIFQRSTLESGFFKLKLRINLPNVNQIRVQVFNSQNPLMLYLAESLVTSKNNLEVYSHDFLLPTGGWYRIQVEQVSSASRQVFRSSVAQFAMGDVFVTSGQSNSTSAGEDLNFTQTNHVSAYIPQYAADGHITGGGSWQLNNDPQPPEGLPSDAEVRQTGISRSNFGSVWPIMADQIYSQQNVPVATAETGIGGTSISQWQKDYIPEANGLPYPPYVRMMETTRYLVATTGVRMILWDQGESDNGPESLTYPLSVYGNKFKKLQADLAADIGQKLPWMIAKASFGPANDHLDGSTCDSMTSNEYWSNKGTPLYVHSIRLAQEKLIADRDAFEGPDTDNYIGATGRYPGPRGRCIHFSKSTMISVGRDWATQIMKAEWGRLPSGELITLPSTQASSASSLPSPAGRTPTLINSGRGCEDKLCLWFVVKDIESDFRLDIRRSIASQQIDWIYLQSRMFVSLQPDGNYAVTLRLSEPEAQKALTTAGLLVWIVNPISRKWTDGISIQ